MQMHRPHSTASKRDVRLDVFRGFALIVIFVGHMPMNPLAMVTPGHFGFSDSAEIFVFASGIAAALAFSRLFDSHGFLVGTARIALRVWQLYWAHIGIFLLILATNALFDRWGGGGTRYLDTFNLAHIFGPEGPRIVTGLITLRYVPNYFDILPMYMVLLAMIPLVMAVSRISLSAVAALVASVWIFADARLLELPAEPWSSRSWYFNPFSWQLIFFTGFAFARGWLPAPPRDKRLFMVAVGILVVSVALAFQPLVAWLSWPPSMHEFLARFAGKTHEGPLRYVHFLALAYVAFVLAGERGKNLSGPISELCRIAGQQALAVFLAGLWLSVVGGYVLYQMGGTVPAAIAVNLVGIAALLSVAFIVGWVKSEPWKRAPKPETPAAARDLDQVPVATAGRGART